MLKNDDTILDLLSDSGIYANNDDDHAGLNIPEGNLIGHGDLENHFPFDLYSPVKLGKITQYNEFCRV